MTETTSGQDKSDVTDIQSYLSGGDLRSIAGVQDLLPLVQTQADFDTLFAHLFSTDRLIVMRAADAVEKLTRTQPEYLCAHQGALLELCANARDIELKWHVALLVSRVNLKSFALKQVWDILALWVQDESESRIVRVNALQSLYNLSISHPELVEDLRVIFRKIERHGVPSINARLKKLKK